MMNVELLIVLAYIVILGIPTAIGIAEAIKLRKKLRKKC
jgi:hypothetical protein